ncbi:MAG: hypothetical protein J7J72_10835, partial [Bacteroidales bacterium]|nr:hypothetical protein [Bacteroidales bacterium]
KQQNARLEEFNRLVSEAKEQMKLNRFQNALKNYLEAETLFENDSLVKEQLTLVKEAIKIEDAYNKALEKADAYYISLALEDAKKAYQEALKIWPKKAYPKNMLDKLDEANKRRTTDLDKINKKYDAKIASADQLFNSKKYEQAYDLYIKALNLKPDKEYPQNQIQKINKILASGSLDILCNVSENGIELSNVFVQITENEKLEEIAFSNNGKHKLKLKLNSNYSLNFKKEGYIHKIVTIDTHLPDNEDLNAEFEVDLSIELFPVCSIDLSLFDKPCASVVYQTSNKEFIVDQAKFKAINERAEQLKNECQQILAEEKKAKEYEALLKDADAYSQAEEYDLAINTYQKAAKMYTDKHFANNKIADIESIVKLNNEYNKFVDAGDLKFTNGKLNDALFDYYKAKNLKPNEAYVKERIAEIDKILVLQDSEEKVYQLNLLKADSLFDVKLWEEAIPFYEKVIVLKESEDYPRKKLEEAKKFLVAQNELVAAYNKAVYKADAYFESQSFSEARKAYLEANKIKPDEQYPLYKIEDINTIVEQKDIRETNNRYNELIVSADKLFLEKAYKLALTQYTQAAKLKPNEVYPPQQIDKINKIFGVQKEADTQYKMLIKSADSAFYLNELSFARGVYVQAKELKPSEKYPPEQIGKIDQILDSQTELEAKYNRLIISADSIFNLNKYGNARKIYVLAKEIKPLAEYPPSQINKIDALLSKMKDKEQNYREAVLRADASFKLAKYENAKEYYGLALTYKPEEAYPKQKIEEIDAIIKQMNALDLAYHKAIEEGDQNFKIESYILAIANYKEALKLKKNEEYPKARITDIETILATLDQLEKAYNLAIIKADEFYKEQKYSEALPFYEDANKLKPEETYPPVQIAQIHDFLGASDKEYQAFIKQGDEAYRLVNFQDAIVAYENALGIYPNEVYPQLMLEKIDAQIRRESVVSLVVAPETIEAGTEQRYVFTPVDYRDRQNNYILIEMKNSTDENIRVFINFGEDDVKNGGYSVNLVHRKGYTKYFVRIDRQLRWQSKDNNWISLLPEGGDLDVNRIQISKVDKTN